MGIEKLVQIGPISIQGVHGPFDESAFLDSSSFVVQTVIDDCKAFYPDFRTFKKT